MKESIIEGEEKIYVKCYKKDGIWIARGNWRTGYFNQVFWLSYEDWDKLVNKVEELRL